MEEVPPGEPRERRDDPVAAPVGHAGHDEVIDGHDRRDSRGQRPEPSKPGVPAEEDPSFEKLPIALEESLEALEQEPATKEFFGEEFVTVYSAMRRYELSRFTDWVTDWERAEYLEKG